jgi:prepilin-type processing-associated H-X9-DG protein
MKQIGDALLMYQEDYDERIFPRVSSSATGVDATRSGAYVSKTLADGVTPNPAYYQVQWWNLMIAYARSNAIFACPSDPAPPVSVDALGNTDIPRSYVVSCGPEDLQLSQVDNPDATIVVTEKWDKADNIATNSISNETWMEPFDGDECAAGHDKNTSSGCLSPQIGYTPGAMVKMSNLHQGGMNNVFYDGHAKWTTPTMIWASADMTGCALIEKYPAPVFPAAGYTEVCVNNAPNSGSPSNNGGCGATQSSNICNLFTYSD